MSKGRFNFDLLLRKIESRRNERKFLAASQARKLIDHTSRSLRPHSRSLIENELLLDDEKYSKAKQEQSDLLIARRLARQLEIQDQCLVKSSMRGLLLTVVWELQFNAGMTSRQFVSVA